MIRSASSCDCRAIWVSETSEPRSACADSMIRWASPRACWTICSRSPSNSWACEREPGSAADTSSSIDSSSALFSTQEADIGMDRALATTAAISSSFFWTSTAEAYCGRSLALSASRTCGGTKWEMSPPHWATSLTRLEDRKL